MCSTRLKKVFLFALLLGVFEVNSFAEESLSSDELTEAEKQEIVENNPLLSDAEIAELKKSAKITRVQELETEMKMYIDECTRLRRMLQETFLQVSQGRFPQDLQRRYVQQSIQIKSLKKDYKDLGGSIEDQLLHKNKSKKEIPFHATIRLCSAQ